MLDHTRLVREVLAYMAEHRPDVHPNLVVNEPTQYADSILDTHWCEAVEAVAEGTDPDVAQALALADICIDIDCLPVRKPHWEITREGYAAIYTFPRSENP